MDFLNFLMQYVIWQLKKSNIPIYNMERRMIYAALHNKRKKIHAKYMNKDIRE